MSSALDLLEERLRTFIETSLKIIPGSQRQATLASRLVAAIERSVIRGPNDIQIVPNFFSISLHPDDLNIWQTHPDLISSLTRVLQETAREVGFQFTTPPILHMIADPALEPASFSIQASTRQPTAGETAAFTLFAPEKTSSDTRYAQAFIIINGQSTYSLELPVINIGRRTDNQVVIDDPRISRVHAQLRAIRGHYILCDLNSTGGSFINGQRITQQILRPGDVISLAGFSLIYGEEAAAGSTDPGLHTQPSNIGPVNRL